MRFVSEQPSLASQTIAGATASTGMAAFPSASGTRDPAAGCILVYYKGKSIIESPTHNKFVGETTFQTSSKKLAWLNGMKARHEGEYNPVAGENDFRVYGKR